MKTKDIKILWGRSGNRCAICKLELTPDGSKETLGEMAHIVGQSEEGPRGNSVLTSRDTYENLILLCPTHHTEIDKNHNSWPVERLKAIKADHEAWVSEQLNTGGIKIENIDNTLFLNQRDEELIIMGRGDVGVFFSLTPLRTDYETINHLDKNIIENIEKARVPGGYGSAEQVNRYRTRPTEYGIANQDIHESQSKYGHTIQIFRVGHCEYFYELGESVNHVTNVSKEKGDDLKGATRVLRYSDLAEIADLGVEWLQTVWHAILPFNYMTFCGGLINTKSTTLYSRENYRREGLLGFPVNSPILKYTEVVTKDFDKTHLLYQFLLRIVNSYGLTLHKLYDDKGEYLRPDKLK